MTRVVPTCSTISSSDSRAWSQVKSRGTQPAPTSLFWRARSDSNTARGEWTPNPAGCVAPPQRIGGFAAGTDSSARPGLPGRGTLWGPRICQSRSSSSLSAAAPNPRRSRMRRSEATPGRRPVDVSRSRRRGTVVSRWCSARSSADSSTAGLTTAPRSISVPCGRGATKASDATRIRTDQVARSVEYETCRLLRLRGSDGDLGPAGR